MRNVILFLLIFLFVPRPVLGAGEVPVLTLDEAVAIALRDNRDILLKSEDVKKAQAKIAEAKAALWPSLNVSGSWLYTRELFSKDYGQTISQATVKKSLYDSGRTANTIRSNEYAKVIAQAVLDRTKLDTVLNVQKSFYTFLLAQELAGLNKEILENTREHVNLIQARHDKGQASGSDILRIRESLAGAEEAYETSVNQVEASSAVLKNLLFIDEKSGIRLQGGFAYDPQEFAYEEAFVKAMKARPEIKQYEAQEKTAGKAVEIARADTRPAIALSADYYSRSHGGIGAVSAGITKNRNDYETIAVTFSWPVFDGWAAKAKVEQAIADLKEARVSKEKIIRDIALELKNAYLSLKNAIARVRAAEADAVLYKDALSSAEQKHKNGIFSSLDVADISLGYRVSLFNNTQAIYDYIVAKFSFDKATGGL